MTRPIRLPVVIVLLFGVACASSAPDPETAVRRYLGAPTRKDAVSMLGPEYRLWFGERSGQGIDRTKVAQMLVWDFALHPRHRIDEITVRGKVVVVRGHEDNDFSLLIGFPGWDATSTYVVDERGRIATQLYVPRAGQGEWRPYLDAPLAWIREHHPDSIARVFPNDRLAQTAEGAAEWVTLLRAWRASTGQPDPTRP